MDADEISKVVCANIDKVVRVVYADGTSQKLFVHTVDDEGFVCDIVTETGQPPPYAYWVRFNDVREVQCEDEARAE